VGALIAYLVIAVIIAAVWQRIKRVKLPQPKRPAQPEYLASPYQNAAHTNLINKSTPDTDDTPMEPRGVEPRAPGKLGEIHHENRAGSHMSDFELLVKIRSLSPIGFEHYIAELFRRFGYKAKLTPPGNDGGIDILLDRDGVASFVQCKKYIDRSVSVSEMRDFYGAVTDQLTKGSAYFVTTNLFTPEAKRFAKHTHKSDQIKLIDGERLIACIRLVEKASGPIKLPTKDPSESRQCPKCFSGRLVKRSNKLNQTTFLGCSNFPICKYSQAYVR